MGHRADWVDYGKGIAIVLVVYGHLANSGLNAGLEIPQRFFDLTHSIIYGFHMPLFFFLSGLFVESGLRKRGVAHYLRDKFVRVAYPYLVWSVLQITVEMLFSAQSAGGASMTDLLAIVYMPWAQFWFLYALLLMHLVFASCSSLGKSAKPTLILLALVLFFFPIQSDVMGLRGFSDHFIFFVSAIVLRGPAVAMAERDVHPAVSWGLLALLLASGYLVFTVLIPPGILADGPHRLYFMCLGVLGTLACVVLSQQLARAGVAAYLAVIGRCSLQIFVVHMLVGVGFRVLLVKFLGIENWIVHIAFGVFIATLAGIMLQRLSALLDFPYLFEWRPRQSAGVK